MIGAYVMTRTNQARNFARRVPLVFALDNPDIFEEANPNAIRIFRSFEGKDMRNDPVTLFNSVEMKLKGYRHSNLIIECLNEEHPTLAQLQTIAQEARKRRFKFALAGCGTGDYTQQDYDNIASVNPDYISIHSYWDGPVFDTDNALRFTKFHRGNVPILITECGRIRGWKGVISAEEMANELKMFADICDKTGYVAGVTPFCNGATKDWDRFNLDPLIDAKLL